MPRTKIVRTVALAAVLVGAGSVLVQYAPAASAKGLSAPIFTSKTLAKAKVNVAFSFSVKTKANPVAAISTGPLPFGVHFVDNGNGTATLSGTEPLSGSYSLSLMATNGISPAANQTLTLSVTSKLPQIRHVFVIMLENLGYSATFGSADPYLSSTLPSQGAFLKSYYGVGHFSNSNYTGFVSGQPPNTSNQADCIGSGFADFPTGSGQDANGIQQGAGCVYPAAVPTVANQLNGEGLTWKGYMEDQGNDSVRDGSAVCSHPAVGGSDPTTAAAVGDGFTTRHDPFVYFHSIIDNAVTCNQNVVPLGTTTGALPPSTPAGVSGLVTDLASIATTPNLSFITPNLCNDGHDYPCHNVPSPTGSAVGDIDAFLNTWVPIITSSPAFQKDGLLEITFDEGEQPSLDSTACCGETPGPAASAGGNGLTGPGGGKVGAVLLSPFILPGTVVTKTSYNHYSSLASIENLFGLPHLGEAKTVTSVFDKHVYTK